MFCSGNFNKEYVLRTLVYLWAAVSSAGMRWPLWEGATPWGCLPQARRGSERSNLLKFNLDHDKSQAVFRLRSHNVQYKAYIHPIKTCMISSSAKKKIIKIAHLLFSRKKVLLTLECPEERAMFIHCCVPSSIDYERVIVAPMTAEDFRVTVPETVNPKLCFACYNIVKIRSTCMLDHSTSWLNRCLGGEPSANPSLIPE